MEHKNNYKVNTFIFGVLLLTWLPWLILVFSGKGVDSANARILIGLGGIAPTVLTLFLLIKYHSKAFVKDYFKRVISLRFLTKKHSLLILLPVLTVITAIVISVVLFGNSGSQLIPMVSGSQIIPFMFFILLFGPLPEELGWRGYLLDGLSEKLNPLYASIIIGIVWGIWHIPLFFIDGYPLREMATSNLFLFVYFGSLIPKSIIMTYLYFKSGRSIMTAILFHFFVNFMGSIMDVSMQAELVQFVIFILVSVVLVFDRELFRFS